jgi:DNA-directed RNA polymerase specialized sigma24 family protein/plasmid stability protein
MLTDMTTTPIATPPDGGYTPSVEDEWNQAVARSDERHASGGLRPPTFHQITKQRWDKIAADYKRGDHSKETVAALAAREASRRVSVDQRDLDEVLSVGFAAACVRYDELTALPRIVRVLHDADLSAGDISGVLTRSGYVTASGAPYTAHAVNRLLTAEAATGDNLDAALRAAAEGHMRNAAAESRNVFNARKHSADDVIPTAIAFDESKAVGREETENCPTAEIVTSGSRDERNATKDRFSYKQDRYRAGTEPGGPEDRRIVAAADRAMRPPPRYKKPQAEDVGRRASAVTREQAKFNVAKLLLKLPPKEAELIANHWGVLGAKALTIKQLAERGGVSEKTVERRLLKFFDELQAIAEADGREAREARALLLKKHARNV